MGNLRFRLSDMMPNAWFYKLKDIGRSRNSNKTNLSRKKKQPTSASTSSATSSQAQPSKPNQPHNSYPRKSYYFTRELTIPSEPNPKSPEPPRKSSRQQRIKGRSAKYSDNVVTSSVSAGCSCRTGTQWAKPDSLAEYSVSPPDISSPEEVEQNDSSFPPEFRSDRVLATESFDNMLLWASCKVDSNPNDIVIKVDEQSLARKSTDRMDSFSHISNLNLDLPQIITKPVMAKFENELEDTKKKKETKENRRSCAEGEARNAHGSLSVKVMKEQTITMKENKTSSIRRHSVNSPGVRLRVNSPRIANRRVQGRRSVSSKTNSSSRRSLSDSLAIVKSSFDPQRDFRDSMMEMIVENGIRATKDLEDLLACYLSLNDDIYHDLIIKVFKQIWFDLTNSKCK